MGMSVTAALYALILALAFLTINTILPPKPSTATLTVVSLRPEASPPETPPSEEEASEPQEKKIEPPQPRPAQVERPLVPIAQTFAPSAPLEPKRSDPAPVEHQNAALRTAPAPPAPQLSSDTPDSWEGRVLAALNKQRRYPPGAARLRQQGVPYVRIIIDREGKILSSRLERSSRFFELDREAVALARRASPLPKPPPERVGDTLELVVPVEFFMQ